MEATPKPMTSPHRDDCVSCGAEFLPNGELATVRAGLRIVFDPSHQRVWRICTSCDTWNLLGPEASATALPELEARFRAGLKSGAAADAIAATLSGGTELLRIGATTATDASEVAAAKRRVQIERRSLWGTIILVGMAGWMAWGWITDPSSRLEVFPAALVMVGMVEIAAYGIELRHGQPSRHALAVGLGMFVAGWALIGISDPVWLLGAIPTAALALVAATWAKPDTEVRADLTSGTRVDFTSHDLPNVVLQWAGDGAAFALHRLPGDRTLVAEEAIECLRALLEHHNHAFRKETEEAFALVRSLGGLPGLLRAIDGFRGEGSEGVHLFELPATYLLALDLALATDDQGTGLARGVLAQHREASDVAAIAEELDVTRAQP